MVVFEVRLRQSRKEVQTSMNELSDGRNIFPSGIAKPANRLAGRRWKAVRELLNPSDFLDFNRRCGYHCLIQHVDNQGQR